MLSAVLDGKTLPEVFLKRVALAPQSRALLSKVDGQYRPTSWAEFHEKSLGVYASLRSHGIGKGDRVAILSNTRPEWCIADITIQTLGAVTVPIYQSNTADEVAFILKNCGAKLVFAEDAAQGEKLKAFFAENGKPLPVVFFEAGVEPGYAATDYALFSKCSDPASAAAEQQVSVAALLPSDLATIVYTSGTTGQSKGVCLPHSALAAEIRAICQAIELTSEDITLAFLPFAHVLGRIESFVPYMGGITLAFAESVSQVVNNLGEVKPTLLFSVPRIYEKIYAKILSDVDSSPSFKKKLFKWSVDIGREVVRLRSEKQPVPLVLLGKYEVADRLVFSKVRNRMGGRIRYSVSGGAPFSRELCEFFHACGILIMEGYGLTETIAAIAVNLPGDYRFGTVGRPLAWTQYRIAEDGEILVKGPALFTGYFKDEASTKQAFTSDGWFRTGDIGEFDDRGFLKITDRKKELIVTSGGKNIAPQKLENLLKQIPLVSNVLVYGDKQKYIVALITLAEVETRKWARERGVEGAEFAEVALSEPVQKHIEDGVKGINAVLPSWESIKRFSILPNDFTLEAGEMTPSLKLKRKVINQKYAEQLEAMY